MSDYCASPVVRLRQVGFSHAGQAPLIQNLTIDLPSGIAWVEGDSGKTTLLRLLAGEWQGQGEILLLGRPIGEDAGACRQAVCWFDPRDPNFDALTPEGLMAKLALRHPTMEAAAWHAHALALGLGPHLDKPLYALSTGSRRKAGLAVALSAGCTLTLLDEPTGGLDGPSMAYLQAALTTISHQSQRVVVLVCSRGLDTLPVAARIRLPDLQCAL